MAKVHIASWRETYPGMLPDPMLARMSVAEEAIRWQRMLDRPGAWGDAVSFVADDHGTIVGYGTCGEQRMPALRGHGFTGEVTELYVLRSSQRLGLGSHLMKAMAASLMGRGHVAMCLWVLGRNEPARLFYERLGGRLIGRKSGGLGEVAYGWTDLLALSSIT
jgi:ribosomal protein S18 acetylase RimI-like enzyme